MIAPEINEGLDRLGKGISSMDTLEDVLRDAHAEITTRFPLTRENLVVISTEMRNTLGAIAMGASIITHLELALQDRASTDEIRRCVAEHERYVQGLGRQLDGLRGQSEVIRAHSDAIMTKVGRPLRRFAAFLATYSPVREEDIAAALDELSEGTRELYDRVYDIPEIVDRTLVSLARDLDLSPANGRTEIIATYSAAFAAIETRANFAALRLQKTIGSLS
jgi:hypothetical protein